LEYRPKLVPEPPAPELPQDIAAAEDCAACAAADDDDVIIAASFHGFIDAKGSSWLYKRRCCCGDSSSLSSAPQRSTMPKSLPDGPGIALREGVHGETHGPKEPSPSWRNSSLLNMARCCSIAGQSLLRQTVRWPLVSVRLPCAGRWIKHDRTVDFDHSHKKIMFFGAVTFSVLFPQRGFFANRVIDYFWKHQTSNSRLRHRF